MSGFPGTNVHFMSKILGARTACIIIAVCLLQLTVSEINIEDEMQDGPNETIIDTEYKQHHTHSEPIDNRYTNPERTDNTLHSDLQENQATGLDSRDKMLDSEIENVQSESSELNILSSDSVRDETVHVVHENQNPKVFSLTNFIKSWLNPVLQEFQEGLNVGKDKIEKNETDISNNTNLHANGLTNNTAAYNVTNSTDTGKRVKFNCTGRNITENTTAIVKLVNSSVLLDFLSFDKNNNATDCVLIMFYAPWCKFCAQTASHFNALGRAFIQLDVLAVDAVHFSNLNARFGTVAVPNIMMFHNSRSAIRFNHTERTFDKLAEFVTNVTGLEPNSSVEVEEIDYIGPLSSVPTTNTDYLLWCAWIFVLLCTSNMFINSRYGQGAIDKVRTLWQEHQHIE